ncbi:MAG: hypothetical protein AAFP92_24940 [Bacteroidota bacterium]
MTVFCDINGLNCTPLGNIGSVKDVWAIRLSDLKEIPECCHTGGAFNGNFETLNGKEFKHYHFEKDTASFIETPEKTAHGTRYLYTLGGYHRRIRKDATHEICLLSDGQYLVMFTDYNGETRFFPATFSGESTTDRARAGRNGYVWNFSGSGSCPACHIDESITTIPPENQAPLAELSTQAQIVSCDDYGTISAANSKDSAGNFITVASSGIELEYAFGVLYTGRIAVNADPTIIGNWTVTPGTRSAANFETEIVDQLDVGSTAIDLLWNSNELALVTGPTFISISLTVIEATIDGPVTSSSVSSSIEVKVCRLANLPPVAEGNTIVSQTGFGVGNTTTLIVDETVDFEFQYYDPDGDGLLTAGIAEIGISDNDQGLNFTSLGFISPTLVAGSTYTFNHTAQAANVGKYFTIRITPTAVSGTSPGTVHATYWLIEPIPTLLAEFETAQDSIDSNFKLAYNGGNSFWIRYIPDKNLPGTFTNVQYSGTSNNVSYPYTFPTNGQTHVMQVYGEVSDFLAVYLVANSFSRIHLAPATGLKNTGGGNAACVISGSSVLTDLTLPPTVAGDASLTISNCANLGGTIDISGWEYLAGLSLINVGISSLVLPNSTAAGASGLSQFELRVLSQLVGEVNAEGIKWHPVNGASEIQVIHNPFITRLRWPLVKPIRITLKLYIYVNALLENLGLDRMNIGRDTWMYGNPSAADYGTNGDSSYVITQGTLAATSFRLQDCTDDADLDLSAITPTGTTLIFSGHPNVGTFTWTAPPNSTLRTLNIFDNGPNVAASKPDMSVYLADFIDVANLDIDFSDSGYTTQAGNEIVTQMDSISGSATGRQFDFLGNNGTDIGPPDGNAALTSLAGKGWIISI